MEFEGFAVDPFTASPAELLASVADLAPGPFVQSVLLMVDPSRLSPEDALVFLQLHDRVSAWWAGVQADALVAAASPQPRVAEYLVLDPRPDRDEERLIRIEDAVREEVAAVLRWSPTTAQRRIDHARLLAGPLASTREALERGEITPAHVSVICEAAERLSSRWARDEVGQADFTAGCRELQERLLSTARRGTVAQTRKRATGVVEAIDASGQARRRAAARSTRDVYLAPACDGIATLVARLDALTARAVMAAVDLAITDPLIAGDCGATIGERRAEALAALVLRQGAGETSLRVNVDVVVPLDRLLALSDDAGTTCEGDVGVEQLRALLDDPAVGCTLRRLVSDPVTGHVLDVGRRSYRVPEPLRRLIVARDRTCRFPGCSRRASACQVDHATAWEDGGGTDAANLGALCTRHHQLKTHAGWRMTQSGPDGSCTWTSPAGRTYMRDPEPLLEPSGTAARTLAAASDPDPPPF